MDLPKPDNASSPRLLLRCFSDDTMADVRMLLLSEHVLMVEDIVIPSKILSIS